MSKSTCKYIIILFIISIIMIGQIVFHIRLEYAIINEYIDNKIVDIKNLLNVSTMNKKGVTEMLSKMIVSEEVISYLEDINNENNKNVAIEKMNEVLSNEFKTISSVGIRELKIYDVESEVVINIDNLSQEEMVFNADEISKQVYSKDQSVAGYKMGDGFYGFRYLYPINHENKYIGSIELSYSIEKVIAPVIITYDVQGLACLNQEQSPKKCNKTLNQMTVSKEWIPKINAKLSQVDCVNEASNYIFEYVIQNKKSLWVLCSPIKDIEDKTVGHITFYKEDEELYNLVNNKNNAIINSSILLIIYVMLLVFSCLFFSQIRNKATHDSLTKLYSRQAFIDTIIDKIDTGVAMVVDIDDFKQINDQYGHLMGDKILRQLSDRICLHIRKNDFAIRWGGEEFMILLMDMNYEIGISRANALLKSINSHPMSGINVTVSIGVSYLTKDYNKSFLQADQALYRAKKLGKNKVCTYDSAKDN